MNSRQPDNFISLMYHNVHADDARFGDLSSSITSYFVNVSTFASQMDELIRLGGTCLSAVQWTALYSTGSLPVSSANPVLLSFDDGWRGVIDLAVPILQSRHGCGILFVTTDFIGRPRFISRRDLLHFPHDVLQLGSHARTHRMLNQLSDAEITAELIDSKHALEDLSGRPVDCLSIPGGALDHRVRHIAAETGYRFLFTSEVHINTPRRGPFSIGRVPIRATTPLDAFRRYVTRRILREQMRRWILQVPKRALGRSGYERLRRRLVHEAPGQLDMLQI